MGLSICIIGFLCLHFHFLNMRIAYFEVFPLTVSLPIIILGFLYSYKEFHYEEYLYFIGLTTSLLVLNFMNDMRIGYLILQTLLYGLYLIFIQKQFPIKNQKSFTLWTILYFITGFLRALFTYRGIHYLINLNILYECVSILSVIAVVITCYYLVKVRQSITIESHPQTIPSHKPLYLQILLIGICIALILFTHHSFTNHIYDQTIHLKTYEFKDDIIKIQYYIDYNIEYKQYIFKGTSPKVDVQLLDNIQHQTLTIYLDHIVLTEGYFTNQNDYIETNNNLSSLKDPFFAKSCYVILDGKAFELEANLVQLKSYSHQNSSIQIQNCLIENNKVYMLPRIEMNQNIEIKKVTIYDQHHQELVCQNYDEEDCYYQDGYSFYYEKTPDKESQYGKGPYTIEITFKKDHQFITREYPLS